MKHWSSLLGVLALSSAAWAGSMPRFEPEDPRYRAAIAAEEAGDAKQALGYLRPLREDLAARYESLRDSSLPQDEKVIRAHFELLSVRRRELVAEFEVGAPPARLRSLGEALLELDPLAPLSRLATPPPVYDLVDSLRAEGVGEPDPWKHVPRLWASEDHPIVLYVHLEPNTNIREVKVFYKGDPSDLGERTGLAKFEPCEDLGDCDVPGLWIGEIPVTAAIEEGPLFYAFVGFTHAGRMVGGSSWNALWIVDSVETLPSIVGDLESLVHAPEGLDLLNSMPLIRFWTSGSTVLPSQLDGIDWGTIE